MTDREAMKQALEALSWTDEWCPDGLKEQAIAALRERLAQPEQERWVWRNAAIRVGEELSSVGPVGYYDMKAAQWLDWAMAQEPRGKNSMAQPEQEPMAWEDVLGAIARGWTHDDNKHKPMDVQLAVAIAKEIQDMVAAPPQRKPLTDEKIEEICWTEVDQRLRSFARGSEAKLKEKNT